ncbi:MAG: SGNH/GDSL hydrolase family protein [Planctomycetota bacterium]
MQRRTARALCLLCSTAAVAPLGWCVWSRAQQQRALVVIDVTEDTGAILRRRAAEPPAPGERDGDAQDEPPPGPPHGPLPPNDAGALFPQLVTWPDRFVYDPHTHFWELPHVRFEVPFPAHPAKVWTMQTNDRGFRNARDTAVARPDLRVLVAGDSHTAGLVAIEETFCALTERLLRTARQGRTVEVLNAGKGGYSFYNYLGTLEKHLELRPHVFVLAVYGGNDFVESLTLHRYFERRATPPGRGAEWRERFDAAREGHTELLAQFAWQVAHLAGDDALQAEALAAATGVTAGIARRCAEHGIRFVCMYVPPAADVQPAVLRGELGEFARAMDLDDDALRTTQRLAARYLAAVRELGVDVLDLTPAFARSDRELYWITDHHLDVDGNALVAELLAAQLDR